MIFKIRKLLKKTPLYSVFFRYNHFRYFTYPKKKRYLKEYINTLKRENFPSLYFDKPTVVNFNANDICNSKCTMCNIWQQKKDHEITPQELEAVLKDPLFSEVTHIGITGGEPTLREDLPQLYQAAINALPHIKGLSIITNAIKNEDVIARIDKVIQVVQGNGKHFSMMVSLDGYGVVHDKIRGRDGNFESAISVIDYFRNKSVEIAIGCTISKDNVWGAEELLHYLKKQGIYGRFRVAEFIKRLYNDDRTEVIRNFSEDERYQLTLFFYKLIYAFEKNTTYKNTYYSIIEVLNGNKRSIGCPYQSKGVVLNSKGELAYCAPKSPIIGQTLKKSALELYRNNFKTRNNILKSDCDNCIHDYHFSLTKEEEVKRKIESEWRRRIKVANPETLDLSDEVLNKYTYLKSDRKKAFIVGWYGTETVGDKAILAGIILDLKKKHGNGIQIIVGSLFPYITNHTLLELDIEAKVVHSFSEEMVACAKFSDITIMGGGPLMDLEELSVPLHAFRTAQKNSRVTIVYGCGIGPLFIQENENVVKEILSKSSEIYLRDMSSVKLAEKFGFAGTKLSGDYAKLYLESKYDQKEIYEKQNVITCYLREWTYEYSRDLSFEDFQDMKTRFEKGLASFIKKKAMELGVLEIKLQHMHNFVIGNDDRDFSRYFIEKYFNDFAFCPITFEEKLSNVDSIVHAMCTSVHNVCMRFHSVLFAHTLGTSFTAVDYTKGGKIKNYLVDNHSSDKMMSIDDFLTY